MPCYSRTGLVGGRVEEATLPRLVSIYSGFPRFPRLCHARSASTVCIILYLFRLVTSYTRSRPALSFLRLSPRSPAPCIRVGSDGRKLRLVPYFRIASCEPEMGYTGYKKIHVALPPDTFFCIFLYSLSPMYPNIMRRII